MTHACKALLIAAISYSLCGCIASSQNMAQLPDQPPSSASSEKEAPHEPLLFRSNVKTTLSSTAASSRGETATVRKMQPLLDEALEFCQLSQEFWQKGELDNALEALDQAYALILNVETEDIPRLIQQKEDLRFTISRRILEIYASRHIVVSGNHNQIPMIINPHIQAEIDLFTTGREKDFFIESYKRSGKYRQKIVESLQEAGLPTEMSWLPLIESGFKAMALSRARALGLWQFIPSTGYKFGLKRDTFVDERLDPVKSTRAAIDYLKELHQMFGDWTTVLAAYNCGEGRVLQVIRTQNVNYLDNFWDLYERLPRETARYVPRFLATLHIVNNLEKYGLEGVEVDPPLEYATVTVSKQIHLKETAKLLDLPEKLLRDLNPELRYQILPPEKYDLKIPSDKSDILHAKIDDIPVCAPPKRAVADFHTVKPGETLSAIAKRYRIDPDTLAQANKLHRRARVSAGQTLKVPVKGGVESLDEVSYGQTTTHAVKSGDSLWILANRYGTTTKTIQDINGLSTTALNIGQKLKIPVGGAERNKPKEKEKEIRKYQVKAGDSPFKIAQQFKMQVERLLRINNLTPTSKIHPGQTLLLD